MLSNFQGKCISFSIAVVPFFDGLSVISLLYSGVLHLGNPYLFSAKLAEFGFEDFSALTLMAWLLASFMTATGLSFLASGCVSLARYFAMCLFFTFTCIQLHALHSGSNISCGCFGYSTEPVSFQSASIPFVLFGTSLFAIVAVRLDKKREIHAADAKYSPIAIVPGSVPRNSTVDASCTPQI